MHDPLAPVGGRSPTYSQWWRRSNKTSSGPAPARARPSPGRRTGSAVAAPSFPQLRSNTSCSCKRPVLTRSLSYRICSAWAEPPIYRALERAAGRFWLVSGVVGRGGPLDTALADLNEPTHYQTSRTGDGIRARPIRSQGIPVRSDHVISSPPVCDGVSDVDVRGPKSLSLRLELARRGSSSVGHRH